MAWPHRVEYYGRIRCLWSGRAAKFSARVKQALGVPEIRLAKFAGAVMAVMLITNSNDTYVKQHAAKVSFLGRRATRKR